MALVTQLTQHRLLNQVPLFFHYKNILHRASCFRNALVSLGSLTVPFGTAPSGVYVTVIPLYMLKNTPTFKRLCIKQHSEAKAKCTITIKHKTLKSA